MARLEGLHPYPTGWFAIAFSSELAVGEVKTVHYFGKDIVLYRTASGEAVAVDPYCVHLGAHLGHGGKVEGDGIRCPFHHWRYASTGEVTDIPNCDKLPKHARLQRWHLREQDDVICVFHDVDVHEGLRDAPREPFAFEPLGSEGYTPGRTIEWTVRTHPQEVAENTVDMAHLLPIHSVPGAHVVGKPVVDGSHLNVVIEFIAPGDLIGMPGQDNDVQLDVIVDGLGRIVARTHVKNVDVRARQAIYCTPIDGERMSLRGVVTLLKSDDEAFTKSLAQLFYDSFVHDFQKDFFVWENKRYVERPILSAVDGPVGVYRRWTRQFYPQDNKNGQSSQARQPLSSQSLSSQSAALQPAASQPAWRERLQAGVTQAMNRAVSGAMNQGRALIDAAALLRGGAGSGRGAQAAAPDKHAPAQAAAPDKHAPAQAGQGGAAATRSPGASAASEVEPGGTIEVLCVGDYFETLTERFVPEGSRGVDAVFQWELSGENGVAHYAVVNDGTMELHEGKHHNPTVTIAMDADDYVKMVNHEIDGTLAFTSGRAKLAGSIPMAMKMRKIFPA